MRSLVGTLGVLIGLAIYSSMIYADLAHKFRYGDYWIIQSGANVWIGLFGFLFALLCTVMAARKRSLLFGCCSLFSVAVIFGIIGYQICLRVYHASWHSDKECQTLQLMICIIGGMISCVLYSSVTLISARVAKLKQPNRVPGSN
jgi:hypothetical protein